MFHIIIATISILLAYKWGDWKNWQKYYSTILFAIIGDLIYNLLSYNYPLWQYEDPILKHIFSDLIIVATVFPSGILVLTPRFPKSLSRGIIFILIFALIFTGIEWLSFSLGYFSYHNGWSIWCSFLFYCIMIPTLWLHHVRPPVAWLIGVIVAVCMMQLFKVPLSSIK